MAKARYVPAQFATMRRMFGRRRDVAFREVGTPQKDAQAWASDLQHRYAMRIRDAIFKKGWTVVQYAEAADVTADHMHKLLRGEAILKLEDMAMADLLVGGVSEFARQGKLPEPTEAEEVKLRAAEQLRLGRLAPKPTRTMTRRREHTYEPRRG